MKEELAVMFAVQQQDTLLDTLKKQFALLDSGHAAKAQFDTLEGENKTAQSSLHGARGDLKDSELEQKQIETKRKEYETKLYSGKVTNPKELQAMQGEIAMLDKQRTALDDKIITLLESVENNTRESALAAEKAKAAKRDLKTKVEEYRVAAEAIRTQAQAVIEERKKVAAQLSEADLKKYEALKSVKAGLAIVAIEDGIACGGCKMALPSSLITRIHLDDAAITCQNCGRILVDVVRKAKKLAAK